MARLTGDPTLDQGLAGSDSGADLNPAAQQSPDLPSAPITPAQPDERQQAIQQMRGSGQAQQFQPQIQDYSYLPSWLRPYEPSDIMFNPEFYNRRMQEVVHHWTQETNTIPTPDIARDLVRSGLPNRAVHAMSRFMVENTSTPMAQDAVIDPQELDAFRGMPDAVQRILSDHKFVSTPTAAHTGIRYDADNQTFQVNPKYPGDPAHDAAELYHGYLAKIDPKLLAQELEVVRSTDPKAVSNAMAQVQKGDYAGAITYMLGAPNAPASLKAFFKDYTGKDPDTLRRWTPTNSDGRNDNISSLKPPVNRRPPSWGPIGDSKGGLDWLKDALLTPAPGSIADKVTQNLGRINTPGYKHYDNVVDDFGMGPHPETRYNGMWMPEGTDPQKAAHIEYIARHTLFPTGQDAQLMDWYRNQQGAIQNKKFEGPGMQNMAGEDQAPGRLENPNPKAATDPNAPAAVGVNLNKVTYGPTWKTSGGTKRIVFDENGNAVGYATTDTQGTDQHWWERGAKAFLDGLGVLFSPVTAPFSNVANTITNAVVDKNPEAQANANDAVTAIGFALGDHAGMVATEAAGAGVKGVADVAINRVPGARNVIDSVKGSIGGYMSNARVARAMDYVQRSEADKGMTRVEKLQQQAQDEHDVAASVMPDRDHAVATMAEWQNAPARSRDQIRIEKASENASTPEEAEQLQLAEQDRIRQENATSKPETVSKKDEVATRKANLDKANDLKSQIHATIDAEEAIHTARSAAIDQQALQGAEIQVRQAQADLARLHQQRIEEVRAMGGSAEAKEIEQPSDRLIIAAEHRLATARHLKNTIEIPEAGPDGKFGDEEALTQIRAKKAAQLQQYKEHIMNNEFPVRNAVVRARKAVRDIEDSLNMPQGAEPTMNLEDRTFRMDELNEARAKLAAEEDPMAQAKDITKRLYQQQQRAENMFNLAKAPFEMHQKILKEIENGQDTFVYRVLNVFANTFEHVVENKEEAGNILRSAMNKKPALKVLGEYLVKEMAKLSEDEQKMFSHYVQYPEDIPPMRIGTNAVGEQSRLSTIDTHEEGAIYDDKDRPVVKAVGNATSVPDLSRARTDTTPENVSTVMHNHPADPSGYTIPSGNDIAHAIMTPEYRESRIIHGSNYNGPTIWSIKPPVGGIDPQTAIQIGHVWDQAHDARVTQANIDLHRMPKDQAWQKYIDTQKADMKRLGDQFGFSATEHPLTDTAPSISPEAFQMVRGVRAGLNQVGLVLTHQEAIFDLLDNFFPHVPRLEDQMITMTLMPHINVLPGNSKFFNARETAETGGEKQRPPGEILANYLVNVGNALINRQAKALLHDAVWRDTGERAFISDEEHPLVGAGKPEGNYIPSNHTGLRGWVHHDVVRELARMNDPHTDVQGFAGAVAWLNDKFRTYAMYNPIVHGWNQISSGFTGGAGLLGPIIHLPMGNQMLKSPEMVGLAGREMYLPGIRQVGEIKGDKVLRDADGNPSEWVDAYTPHQNKISTKMHNILWENTVRAQKMAVWWIEREKGIAAGLTEEEAGMVAGAHGDKVAGQQNPATMANWEKFMQKYVAFAYTWVKKHVILPTEAIPGVGMKLIEKEYPQFNEAQRIYYQSLVQQGLFNYAVSTFGSLQLANMLTTGHPTWENEPGRELAIRWGTNPDGTGKYFMPPNATFMGFYQSLAQPIMDYGWRRGVVDDIANKTLPMWSILLNMTQEGNNATPTRTASTVVQSINPLQRMIFGPEDFTKLIDKYKNPVDTAETIAGQAGKAVTGIKTYNGPHRPFEFRSAKLEQQRTEDLYLALRMHVDPLHATPEQRQQAQQALSSGQILGVNPVEFAQETLGGSPVGSRSPLHGLQAQLDNEIDQAARDMGFTQKQIDDVRTQHGTPLNLMNAMQRQQVYYQHPDIQNAKHAATTDPDPQHQRIHDAVVTREDMLARNLAEERAAAVKLEQEYNSGADYNGHKMSIEDWIAEDKKIKQKLSEDDQQTYRDTSLADQYNKLFGPDKFPQSPEDLAYHNYHSISINDFKNDDGTIDYRGWQKARSDFLAGQGSDVAQYIQDREYSMLTPMEQEYRKASEKYNKFKDVNISYERQLSQLFDPGTSVKDRKLLFEMHPELNGFMAYRDQWFADNPDVARFFHPAEEEKFGSYPTHVQAMHVAEWANTAGPAKHPEYLTPWERQFLADPKLQEQYTSKWSEQDLQLYQDTLEQQTDDYEALRAKFASYRRRRGYATKAASPYAGVPLSQQPNIFTGVK